MCQNQTFSNFFQSFDDFLDKYNIHDSFLTFQNFNKGQAEKVEISIPYVILYEMVDRKSDRSNWFELTEYKTSRHFSSYRDFYALNNNRPLHYHDFYELTIVLSGEITLQIENETVHYHAGDCFICNKNIRHREIPDSDYEIVLFMLTENYVRSVLDSDLVYDATGNSTTPDTFFQRLFDDNQKNHFYDAKEYIDFRLKTPYNEETFLVFFNQMVSIMTEYHAGKSYAMKALFCRFIEYLEQSEFYETAVHISKLSAEETLLYQLTIVLDSCDGVIKRDDLANRLGYHPDYLNRVVKNTTGKTLSEYSRRFTLHAMAKKLRNTNITIGALCEEYGYTNRSFFNRIFAEQYKMSPSEYRRKYHSA
jgi:AraC-like DNA-binding protein/mannose-6-phosphate isomerase-like protein (cupin superfamily)